jgi:LmbE family N-acetylglucosaminyl deacetylase
MAKATRRRQNQPANSPTDNPENNPENKVVDEQTATPTPAAETTTQPAAAVNAETSGEPAEDKLTRVMVIGAHPDDPEFGAGGTIGKLAAQGKEITYVLATSGDKGSHDPNVRPGQLATRREQEQRNAAAVLGVKEVIYLRYPDGILENTLALRARLAHIIRRYKPHIVFAIDPWRHYQLAPDHRAAGFAALDALWAAREWHIFAEQLEGDEEPWRVSQAYLYWSQDADHYEEISESIDKKIEALACHVSQVGADTAKLGERIRERAKATGEGQGMAFAESFKLVKF